MVSGPFPAAQRFLLGRVQGERRGCGRWIEETWTSAGGLAFAGVIGALLFAWSGLYNVAATRGHWAVTDWFLHFAMRNSVKT